MLEELSTFDTKIRLSILPDDELSQASDRFSISSEVGLYLVGDSAEVNLFFKSSTDMQRDLRVFLQRFDAIEKKRRVEDQTKDCEVNLVYWNDQRNTRS